MEGKSRRNRENMDAIGVIKDVFNGTGPKARSRPSKSRKKIYQQARQPHSGDSECVIRKTSP